MDSVVPPAGSASGGVQYSTRQRHFVHSPIPILVISRFTATQEREKKDIRVSHTKSTRLIHTPKEIRFYTKHANGHRKVREEEERERDRGKKEITTRDGGGRRPEWEKGATERSLGRDREYGRTRAPSQVSARKGGAYGDVERDR